MGIPMNIQISTEEIAQHPNNYSLGEYVRRKAWKLQQQKGDDSTPLNDTAEEESDEEHTL